MAPYAVVFGGLLVILGLIGFFQPGVLGEFPKDKDNTTALIPAGIGAVILLCGLITFAMPATRKHTMHLAALAGVFGFLGGFMPLVRSNFNFAKASAVSGMLLSGLSLVFVFLCVKSFIDARKAREQAASTSTSAK